MKGRKDGRDIVRPEDRVRLGSISLRVECKTECKVRRKDKSRNASCDNVARVRGRKMSISNIVDNLSRCCESERRQNDQRGIARSDERANVVNIKQKSKKYTQFILIRLSTLKVECTRGGLVGDTCIAYLERRGVKVDMHADRECIPIDEECSFRRFKTTAPSQSISLLIEKTYWAVFAKAFHTTDIASFIYCSLLIYIVFLVFECRSGGCPTLDRNASTPKARRRSIKPQDHIHIQYERITIHRTSSRFVSIRIRLARFEFRSETWRGC